MTNYKCSKCNLGVIIIPEKEPIKACKCEATIVAEIEADAYGHGGMSKLHEWFNSEEYKRKQLELKNNN
jgi:DNA-directed RNA polymerase subunit RPC12/RpoP